MLAVVLGLVDYVRVLLDRNESDTSWPIGLVSHAAKNGDEAMVNLLLDRGADVQEINIHGQTPLHEAVRKGHRDVVVCLLNRGANILAPSGKDKTMTDFDSGLGPVLPLAIACNGSHLETLSVLLEHVKSEDTANWALRWAVEGRNTDAIKRVLQLPMVNVNAMGKRHWDMTTPLSSACSRRDLPVIEVLLAAGADPRILHHHPPSVGQRFAGAVPPRADTALHQLSRWPNNHGVRTAETTSTEARNRMMQCFRRLLDAGADVHQRNDEDATPLLVAADSIAVEELLRAGSDVNARDFWGATILHRTDSAAVALAVLDVAGGAVDLNAGSAHGRSVLSPLLGWIKKGSVEVVLRLLELGASAAVKDSKGDGVFHYLAQQSSIWPDSEPLISAFLSRGADINSANSAGQTILQLLAGSKASKSWQSTTKGHDIVLGAVLKAGANVEIRDVDGRTPLFHLAQASRLDAKSVERISKTLIDAGADLDTRDKEGRSLLHAAAGTLNVDLLEFLLHNGARADAVDASGNTIWHEVAKACKSAHPTETNLKCLGKMATIGADPKRSNHAGRTPLHILSATPPTNGEDAAKKAVAKVSRFEILLSLYDGSLDVVDERGVTPLHLASEGCEHHLRRLLDHGADPTRVTGEGLSALHIAARARRENISALLIQHMKARYGDDDKSLSAFVNLKDGKGNQPCGMLALVDKKASQGD
jgi:ankyrin repeat protein